MPTTVKKIDPGAYNALADALALIYWNKNPWRRYMRGAFRDAPELLVGLNYDQTKRDVSGEVIDRLMVNERKYQSLTLSLMLSISKMESFPNLEIQPDAQSHIRKAEAAVKELRKWTKSHDGIAQEHEEYAKRIATAAEEAQKSRVLSESLEALKSEFMAMYQNANPQQRGLDFEKFLNRLFGLFDLEPRAAYSLKNEQIDGAFSFDTDDYILEARWRKDPVGRDQLDVFKAKVGRKGKNALGLCVSINGFSLEALDEYSVSTPFIVMDGMDLIAILDGRLRLDDVLRLKKRYANETGHCFLPVKDIF